MKDEASEAQQAQGQAYPVALCGIRLSGAECRFFVGDLWSEVLNLRSWPIPWQWQEIDSGPCQHRAGNRRRRQRLVPEVELAAHGTHGAADRCCRREFPGPSARLFGVLGLSPSEQAVAVFAMKGFSNGEIAELRGTSASTIKSQMNSVFRKAGFANRQQLISFLVEDLLAGVSAEAPEALCRQRRRASTPSPAVAATIAPAGQGAPSNEHRGIRYALQDSHAAAIREASSSAHNAGGQRPGGRCQTAGQRNGKGNVTVTPGIERVVDQHVRAGSGGRGKRAQDMPTRHERLGKGQAPAGERVPSRSRQARRPSVRPEMRSRSAATGAHLYHPFTITRRKSRCRRQQEPCRGRLCRRETVGRMREEAVMKQASCSDGRGSGHQGDRFVADAQGLLRLRRAGAAVAGDQRRRKVVRPLDRHGRPYRRHRRLHEVVIGNNVIAAPANAIRFERARRDGIAARLDLYLHWPDLEGYSEAAPQRLQPRRRRRRIIFLSFEERMMSRDMSGRFQPIYAFDDRQARRARPWQASRSYGFGEKSGYLNEVLAVASGRAKSPSSPAASADRAPRNRSRPASATSISATISACPTVSRRSFWAIGARSRRRSARRRRTMLKTGG